MNRLFSSSGQSIVASSSASVLPTNIQSWFPLGLTGLILQFKGLSRVFSSTTVQKHQFFSAQPSLYSPTLEDRFFFFVLFCFKNKFTLYFSGILLKAAGNRDHSFDRGQGWGRPISSVYGISQARILEWVVISFSKKTVLCLRLICLSLFRLLPQRQ